MSDRPTKRVNTDDDVLDNLLCTLVTADTYLDRDVTVDAIKSHVADLVQAERDAKNAAYAERNRIVVAFAKLARRIGCRIGIARPEIPGWEPEWLTCLYVDTAVGQLSWHFHDSEVHLLAGIGAYPGQWDGHTTEEKYRRLESFHA